MRLKIFKKEIHTPLKIFITNFHTPPKSILHNTTIACEKEKLLEKVPEKKIIYPTTKILKRFLSHPKNIFPNISVPTQNSSHIPPPQKEMEASLA